MLPTAGTDTDVLAVAIAAIEDDIREGSDGQRGSPDEYDRRPDCFPMVLTSPRPRRYITPRLVSPRASPCSAARRYSVTAASSS